MDFFRKKLQPTAAADDYTLPSRPQVTRTYISRKRREELESEKADGATSETLHTLDHEESTKSENILREDPILVQTSIESNKESHVTAADTGSSGANPPKTRTIDSYFLKAPSNPQPQFITSHNSLKRNRPADITHDDIKGKNSPTSTPTPFLLLSSSPSPPKRLRTSITPSRPVQKPSTTPTPQKQPKKYEQLFLDLGQKNAGLQKCAACGMEYTVGKGEDETLHDRYHKAMTGGMEWMKHANEIVLQTYREHDGGKIILVGEGSSGREKRKVGAIAE
ncbi:N-acetyltransferase esco2 [Rhizophlyctis rosea]|uniref:N-acetyltransferase esco2 n=1 Tax=Rhizophlyctis rosea TaxID=64517 RepID=A0AAD5S8C2_9FUNG|nr:N-acetyltransferase esco2 [Rhizophlyctis rosea]